METGGASTSGDLQEALEAIANLERALDSRTLIACAQGMLMERYRLDAPAAMSLLKRLSMDRQVKVRTLAADVIAGRLEIPADPAVLATRPAPRRPVRPVAPARRPAGAGPAFRAS